MEGYVSGSQIICLYNMASQEMNGKNIVQAIG